MFTIPEKIEQALEDDRPEPECVTQSQEWEQRPERMLEVFDAIAEGNEFEMWQIIQSSTHRYASALREQFERKFEELPR